MAMPNLAVVLKVVLTQVDLDAMVSKTDPQEGLRLHIQNVHKVGKSDKECEDEVRR